MKSCRRSRLCCWFVPAHESGGGLLGRGLGRAVEVDGETDDAAQVLASLCRGCSGAPEEVVLRRPDRQLLRVSSQRGRGSEEL